MLSRISQEVARMLYNRGAFKLGAFELKLHEKNPDAPLSPFFVSIRNKDNPTKPGNFQDSDYNLIAKCLLSIIRDNKLEFDTIVGIPRAGDPIVDAMQRMINSVSLPHLRSFRIAWLDKEEKESERRIVPMRNFKYEKGECILLIDDLVTRADTKIEAIRAVESFGSKVVGLIVLIDREQGGKG